MPCSDGELQRVADVLDRRRPGDRPPPSEDKRRERGWIGGLGLGLDGWVIEVEGLRPNFPLAFMSSTKFRGAHFQAGNK